MKNSMFYDHKMLEDLVVWPRPLFWLSCISYVDPPVKFNYLILSCSHYSHLAVPHAFCFVLFCFQDMVLLHWAGYRGSHYVDWADLELIEVCLLGFFNPLSLQHPDFFFPFFFF